MQLFTIGLYELNPDGTHRLDANDQPIETYGQSDVTNLARVFTGYDWDYLSQWRHASPTWPGTTTRCRARDFATDPMKFDRRQSFEPGGQFPRHAHSREHAGRRGASRSRSTALFNHPNVGPFFARQMIQRLVTSNP